MIRLNRSQLAVPGIRTELFEKAARSAADVVFLDLEDSVAPADKARARSNAVAALKDIDWGRKTMSVRVNAFDGAETYRDVIAVAEACPRLDLILLPKVNRAADIHALDTLLAQIERAIGRATPIGIEALIETAQGLMNVEAIAAASPRLESLHFGPGDFAASMGVRQTTIGGGDTGYAMARIAVAARAHGLRPVDGPYGDFKDQAGFDAAAARARALGYVGKWAIHPTQIAAANAAFTPTPDEIARARAILAAMKTAAADNRGAVALDGQLIDYASIRQAEVIVTLAEQIG